MLDLAHQSVSAPRKATSTFNFGLIKTRCLFRLAVVEHFLTVRVSAGALGAIIRTGVALLPARRIGSANGIEAATINDLAKAEGFTGRFVSRMVRLACLLPGVLEWLVIWRDPPAVSVNELIEGTYLPWAEQIVRVIDLVPLKRRHITPDAGAVTGLPPDQGLVLGPISRQETGSLVAVST